MEITNRCISKKREIEGNRADVWKLWTTHDGLASFFGAENRIELIPGGAFEIYFLIDNPYGLRGSEGCKVLSFLPEKMLSFSWNAPPQYREVRESEYKTWVVVGFEESTGSLTKVSLDHTGWPGGPGWNDVFDYFEKAWDRVLEELEKSVKGGLL